MKQDRRKEPRIPAGLQSLWVIAPDGSRGAVACLENVSARGARISLDRRVARRLVVVLERACTEGSFVELADVPREGYRRARLVWFLADSATRTHFGLELTEPVGRLIDALGETPRGD